MNTASGSIEFALLLPITQQTRHWANQLAQIQPTEQKAQQVRLNTIAVCVVNDYLRWMNVPTDLTAGDCWNPVVCLGADVADLVLPQIGRLECRAMETGQRCSVPPESWHDRIGFVVVEIDQAMQQATMLGFIQAVQAETIEVSQLQPPEALLEHLARLQSTQPIVHLSEWFQNIVSIGWQTVETLTSTPELGFAFRNNQDVSASTEFPVRQVKVIDFGMQLAGQTIALVVALKPKIDQQTEILLKVYPTGNQAFLPAYLTLMILDQTDAVFLQAQSRSADSWIQLQFSGAIGEQFKVKLSLNDASITEAFLI